MNKLRHIHKVRILPEYFLFVFLLLASFNLNGSLAEAPLTHAEIAYIEWVAQSQELEEDEGWNNPDKITPQIHVSEAFYSGLKTDFLQSLLIQQRLALIGLERQNLLTAILNSNRQHSPTFPLILYSTEEAPFVSKS
ncbi:MAG: hypothetical protein AAGD28_08170 [Bacteroidota bacterium]